jgi:stage II sporulation protein D
MKEKREIPELHVGICSGKEISFTLNSPFKESASGTAIEGSFVASLSGNKINLKDDLSGLESISELTLSPVDDQASSFTIHAVTIGVNFHWQRSEDQIFKGKIKFIVEDNKITAVNIISIEDYLTSVISSEMKATSSEELLKAHAVVSRSWLLAQIDKSRNLKDGGIKYETHFVSDDEVIRWYDREDHKNFDVCADDHCQRYQGITRASTHDVARAIERTSGEVLTSDGSICDTRYYKCCGGITELFENVWEPVSHHYLQKVIDNPHDPEGFTTNLEDEKNAREWILGNPEAFCNTHDKTILCQVLNDYDQETNDFFRWKVSYVQQELSDLVKLRTGFDFGIITDLIPLERGTSGRIRRLKIVGTQKSLVIGKELEIRKSLSKSHLYSSCFFVEKLTRKGETRFILHGAGWGHGVGLCQIGAAVMGSKGYTYREILLHYFRGSQIETIY